MENSTPSVLASTKSGQVQFGFNVVGYLKGKSAIQIARKFGGRQKNFTGEHFWARGYFVSTVGLDENIVRAYIRNQEEEDERYDQMKLAMG